MNSKLIFRVLAITFVGITSNKQKLSVSIRCYQHESMASFRSKLIGIVVLSVLSSGCNFYRTSEYTMYYDAAKTKMKMQGFMDGARETGYWSYFDQDGNKVQEGKYEAGLMIGQWKYHYSYFYGTINWNVINDETYALKLSLPSTFRLAKPESPTLLIAWDTTKGAGFAITPYDYHSDSDMAAILKRSNNELRSSFVLMGNASRKIVTYRDYYYYAYFDVLDTLKSKSFTVQTYVGRIGERIINMGYRAPIEDSLSSKAIFSDIFQHVYYKGSRVNDPFAEVKEALER